MKTKSQPRAAGEAAHTPTPWIIDDRDSASSVRIGSATDRQATGLVGRIYGNKAGDAQANAAFIVRACNSHAVLVAALDALLVGALNNGASEHDALIAQARSALQSATQS